MKKWNDKDHGRITNFQHQIDTGNARRRAARDKRELEQAAKMPPSVLGRKAKGR